MWKRRQFSPTVLVVALIVFAVPLLADREGEKPTAEACSGDRFPMSVASPAQCCQLGNKTWHITPSKRLAFRTYGKACTEADGIGTNCGVGSTTSMACYYGPCGGHSVWAVEAEDTFVFIPYEKPSKCGWEARNITEIVICEDPDGCDGWQSKGVRFSPEPYIGQSGYYGTEATCPFVRCRAGVPE